MKLTSDDIEKFIGSKVKVSQWRPKKNWWTRQLPNQRKNFNAFNISYIWATNLL